VRNHRRALLQAPISEQMTFWITEVGDGFAAFEGEPAPHLLIPMGGFMAAGR
jgi:hypothetical protein